MAQGGTMNISIGYLWEKFWVAVDALVGNGPLGDRLSNVVPFLDLLEAEDFPTEELQERFRKL
jgi:hypothetical protein